MSWYGQKAAGFWRAGPEDVAILPKKLGGPKDRKAAAAYTRVVLDETAKLLPDSRWIAADCHNDDAKAEDQWVWEFVNTEHKMEVKYAEGASAAAVESTAKLHRGMGWRFPKLYVFDSEPKQDVLDALRRQKCPWAIESELREEDVPPPPPPDDDDLVVEIKAALAELTRLVGLL